MSDDRFRFVCQSCQYRARIPGKYADQFIKCPSCGFAQYATPQDAEMPTTGNTQAHQKVESAKPAADEKFRYVCKDCAYRARIPSKYLGMAIVCPGCSKPQVAERESEESAPTGKTLEIRKIDLGAGGERYLYQCGECGYRARLPMQYKGLYIKCPGCNANQQAVSADENQPSTGNTVTLKKVEPGSAPTDDGKPAPPAAPAAPAAAGGGLDLGGPADDASDELHLDDDETTETTDASQPEPPPPPADAAPADEADDTADSLDPFAAEDAQRDEPDPEADALLEELRSKKSATVGKRKGAGRKAAGTAAPAAVASQDDDEPADVAEASNDDEPASENDEDDTMPARTARKQARPGAGTARPAAAAASSGDSPPKALLAVIAILGLGLLGTGWLWWSTRTQLIATEIELDKTQQQLSTTTSERDTAQTSLAAETEAHAASKQKLSAEQTAHKATRNALATEREELAVTRGELERSERMGERLEAELNKAQAALGESNAQLTTLKGEHQALQKRMADAQEALDEAKQLAEDNLNKGAQSAKSLVIRLESVQKENQRLHTRVENLEAEVAALERAAQQDTTGDEE